MRVRGREKERGRRTLRVVLLARRKHIPPWAGLHTILWPPGVISGARNCSGAVGRSTGSIQSVDDNIIAVLGIFFAKSVNAVGIVRLSFGLMKQQVAEPSHAMA